MAPPKKRLGTRILFGAVHLTSLGLVEGPMISTFLPCFPRIQQLGIWNSPVLYLNFFAFQNLKCKPNNELETWSIYSGTHVFAMNIHYVGNVDGRLLTPHIHGPSRPTSNSPVLQPMVSWPDMLSAAGSAISPVKLDPPPPRRNSRILHLLVLESQRLTGNQPCSKKSTRVFRCYLGIFRCYVRIFFYFSLRCIGIEIAASTLCSYLESKHIQIYIILVKLKSSAFSLSKNCKIHQDPKRSKVLWIRLASSGPIGKLLESYGNEHETTNHSRNLKESPQQHSCNMLQQCYQWCCIQGLMFWVSDISPFQTYYSQFPIIQNRTTTGEKNKLSPKTQPMIKCFGLVVWIPGIPLWKGLLLRGNPRIPKPPTQTISWQNSTPLPQKKDEKQPVPPFCEGGRSICVTPRDEPIWFHCREPAEVVILFRWNSDLEVENQNHNFWMRKYILMSFCLFLFTQELLMSSL